MKEFGSDFHYLMNQEGIEGTSLYRYYPDATFYATGRQALIDLYVQMGWKRLWVPRYFCYDVLASMKSAGLNVALYTDYPTFDEREEVVSLQYEEGDALLRVNYFGLRSRRSNCSIPVPVVEDHTHDLIGDWAVNSDADWCIASVRKSLPVAEGGILWSPRGRGQLSEPPKVSEYNEKLASARWEAMRKKTLYLDGAISDKKEFRQVFVSSEDQIGSMAVSALDVESSDYIKRLDVLQWYNRKRENWTVLKCLKVDACRILEPEDVGCYPFSLVILFDDEGKRNKFRDSLIRHDVYPAILWSIPGQNHSIENVISRQMLSVHCDARYSIEDIMKLRDIIMSC